VSAVPEVAARTDEPGGEERRGRLRARLGRLLGRLIHFARGPAGTYIGMFVVLALFLVPLRGLLRSQGPPMEEGFMLTFPQRVLRGEVPNADFLHLYGPGSLWVLAGFFKVFGDALSTERAVGLLQQMGLVFGVFMLARHWGRTLATFAGVISVTLIIPPLGLVALAWVGGAALAVWSLWLALEARRRLPSDPARARRFAVAAGVVAGFALLYRLDLVVALAGALAVAVWGGRHVRLRRPLLAGAAAGLSPYLIHLATAGAVAAFRGMVLDPVIYLRGGRRLPIPPNPEHFDGFLQRSGAIYRTRWPFPELLSTPSELTAWCLMIPVVAVLLVGLGYRYVRREPASFHGRALLAIGVFSVGLLPQAFQRVDSAHMAWVTCISFAFLPVAVYELLRRLRVLRPRAMQLIAGFGVVAMLLTLIPHFFGRSYLDYAFQTFGRRRIAYRVHYNGRTFYYGRSDVAARLDELLPDIDKVSKPGDRLLVAPTDMRKTPYSEAFIYYFFPELRPGTYYIEMDPGVANREGSRLADDVASSDVVVLSSVWSLWFEPNDSLKFGSPRPNQVLRERFHLFRDYEGLYQLWLRNR
jgi:hypothetical protein